MSYKRKLTFNLTPESAKLEYDRGLELEFTCDNSDVLEFFEIKDIVEYFDVDELLEMIGQGRVEEWVSENNQ